MSDIDLQWFADDDDDNTEDTNQTSEPNTDQNTDGPSGVDVTSLFDDDKTNDPEILGEETYNTNLNDEFTMLAEGNEGKEINLDTGREGHSNGYIEESQWSDSDDAQDLKNELNHDYSRANTSTVDKDGNVNRDWMHNAAAAGRRAGDKVVDKVSGWIDAGNRMFGGSTNGYTSADLERNKEAREAYKTYDDKAKQAEKALNDFANKYDKNNKEDVEKYNQLKAEYEDLSNRRDSINKDIHSTDTGSRLGNMGNNILEDLGDAGTRINQFFGGADQYGLGAKGQINDRDGDGKVSIGERARNMGRDVVTWAGNQLKDYGTAILGGALSFGNPLLGYGITKAAQKGIDALVDYARSHPNNLTSQEKEELAQAEKENNSMNDSSSYDDAPNEPVQTASISADNTPQVARNNWTDMKLNALGNNQQSFGGWNKVNDTMGQRTLALSDAHLKDFVLAMMTDEPGIHEIIKTRLMLDYFK